MENLKKVFSESDVEAVAEKVLSSVAEKIKGDIADSIYSELEDYLYEHYRRVEDRVEHDLLASISEEYKADPTKGKYRALRNKMWGDNREALAELLVDEAIEESVKKVILNHTSEDYRFSWEWKDGIVKFILDNWSLFKEDDRINNNLLRKIDQKDSYIQTLKQEIEGLIG